MRTMRNKLYVTLFKSNCNQLANMQKIGKNILFTSWTLLWSIIRWNWTVYVWLKMNKFLHKISIVALINLWR